MNKKIIIRIVVAFVIIGGFYYVTQGNIREGTQLEENTENGNNTESYEVEVGKEVPSFSLVNLDGDRVSIEDYRGKIVLLNFWATWCKYCDMEMPDLERFYKENKDKDLVVLAVDFGERESKVKAYINKGGYTFPVVLDKDKEIAKNYLVGAFPTSYFIDKDGKLLGGVKGMMTYSQMNEILDSIR